MHWHLSEIYLKHVVYFYVELLRGQIVAVAIGDENKLTILIANNSWQEKKTSKSEVLKLSLYIYFFIYFQELKINCRLILVS